MACILHKGRRDDHVLPSRSKVKEPTILVYRCQNEAFQSTGIGVMVPAVPVCILEEQTLFLCLSDLLLIIPTKV